jgi:type II secretory pathway component PulK
MDNLIDWADRTYEKRTSSGREQIPPKKAPFYSISELHMIPPIDDQLYELFAPNLTVSMTPGLNINTMREPLLRALVQDMTEEEVKEFFEFRDADNADNQFKGEEDFFNYLKNKVASFKDNQGAIDKLKEKIRQNNIRLVTDESVFKITVQAQVNQATKLLQAWVQLSSPNKTGVKQPDHGQTATPAAMPSPTPPDAGLKVTFMRIL